ncbi:STAS domain-containing protein [Conexibacter woesei]|nr:STAS domain-containing protein [Conexibacter woesei]
MRPESAMTIEHDIGNAHDGPFGLHAAKLGGTYRMRLRGEFDLAAVETVEDALARAFDGDTQLLEIDLGQLTFLDSSGLRTILEARDRAASSGVRLRLVRGIEPVQRVFAITGLEASLPFADEPCG